MAHGRWSRLFENLSPKKNAVILNQKEAAATSLQMFHFLVGHKKRGL
jgi:hypothetical protein